MKEHRHRKHRRGSRGRDPSDRSYRHRSSSPESNEEQHSRKQHHRIRHHHTAEEPSRKSSKSFEEREKERDRKRRGDPHADGGRPSNNSFKVKEEPVDHEEVRERVEPTSSKWDEEEDQRQWRGRNHGESRTEFRERRGGRGGGRGGNRGSDRKRFPIKEEDTSNMEWGKKAENSGKTFVPPAERDKPNFGLSGKLTEDSNTYKGIVIKYSEPLEARVPKRRWRLYPFKGDEALKVLHLHRASAFLLGRERKVVDIPLDHPSCSKQHAALQFRQVEYSRDDGSTGKRIRPYIIDLDSANGTFVNNNKIEARKYVELLERDVLKFGYSSREYVLLHEHSKDDESDDM